MERDMQAVAAAGLLVGGGVLVLNQLNILTGAAFTSLGAAGVIGVLTYLAYHYQYFESLRGRFESVADAGQFQEDDFNQLWEDLQEWMQTDPRDTEIIFKEENTFFTNTLLPNVDGEQYRALAIYTKQDKSDEFVFVVIEPDTGSILHYDPNDETFTYKHPFKNVPLIRDLRRQRRSIDVDELTKRLRRSRVGALPGSYSLPMGGSSDESGDGEGETA